MSELKLAILGGCGSSGTTLLTHLVSRHPEIASGPEFNCFNHRELYDFQTFPRSYKDMFEGHSIPSGFVDVHVFMTYRDVYGVSFELLDAWVKSSSDVRAFVGKLTKHITGTLEAPYFVEKSPTNVYAFEDISRVLGDVPIVHLIRDGRDVAVSLRKRGFNLFGAGSRWLYDTVAGLRGRRSKRYLELRYEDLVRDPDNTLNQIFAHFGLDSLATIAGHPTTGQGGVYVEDWSKRKEPRVWTQTPADPVSTASVGRFKHRLSDYELALLYRIALTPQAREHLRSEVATFGELLEELGYDMKYRVRDVQAEKANTWREWNYELSDYKRRLIRFFGNSRYGLPSRYTKICRRIGG